MASYADVNSLMCGDCDNTLISLIVLIADLGKLTMFILRSQSVTMIQEVSVLWSFHDIKYKIHC